MAKPIKLVPKDCGMHYGRAKGPCAKCHRKLDPEKMSLVPFAEFVILLCSEPPPDRPRANIPIDV